MEKLHKNLFYKCKQNIGHIKKNISIPMTNVADLSGHLCINTTPITNSMPTSIKIFSNIPISDEYK
jgi:hypothetical protein